MTEQYVEPTVPEFPGILGIQARVNFAVMNRMMAERFSAFMPSEIRRVVIGAEQDVAPVLTDPAVK